MTRSRHLQGNGSHCGDVTLNKFITSRLAEIIEIETENYLKMDPDPFDERHPSRTDPECKLGQILKMLFRKDNFMNKVNRKLLVFSIYFIDYLF